MLQLLVLCALLAGGFYLLNERRQRQTADDAAAVAMPVVQAIAALPPLARPRFRLRAVSWQETSGWLRWQALALASGPLPRSIAAVLLVVAAILAIGGQLSIDGK